MSESSNIVDNVNPLRYIGLYQFGEAALVDAGYYKKPTSPAQKPGDQYNNDWTGKWKGKHGVNNKKGFMSSRNAQDIAVREYHKIIWENYLKDYHKYEGQKIGGIILTKSGMIAASHLVGHDGVKKFIKSNGVVNPDDAHGTTCYKYLKKFSGYEVDYSTDKLIKQLELEQQEEFVAACLRLLEVDEQQDNPEVSAMELLKLTEVKKSLNYKEICEKFTFKCANLIAKFTNDKQNDLDQEAKSAKTKGNAELEAMQSTQQAQLDAINSELTAKGQARVKAVFDERMAAAAEHIRLHGGTIKVNTDDVAAKENINSIGVLTKLAEQFDSQLQQKKEEFDKQNFQLLLQKKDIAGKEIDEKQKVANEYLKQMLAQINEGKANEETLEANANEFIANFEQELLGTEHQLEHAA